METEKVDHFAEVQRVAADASALAQAGNLAEAVNALLRAEKRARLAIDWKATSAAAVHILRLCYEARDFDALLSNIVLLSKRRSQHSNVIVEFVKYAKTLLDQELGPQARLGLINTLRDVSEGKIYLELERAQLTMQLAKIREQSGDVLGAATVLQEVQVETVGSMDKYEKTDFVLEQMRLTLSVQDLVRTRILGTKVSKEHIAEVEPRMQDLKLRYYDQLIQYHTQEGGPAELWTDFEAKFNTPKVQAVEADRQAALEHYVLFLALTEHCIEQNTALHGVLKLHKKAAEKSPAFQELARLLTQPEVAPWPLPSEATLRAHPIFNDTARWGAENVGAWWGLLHQRVVEHNVRVVSTYYSQVRLEHLSRMLGLDADTLEVRISEMVTGSQKLYARIDRPAGIVRFERPKPVDEVLNDWAADVSEVLKLIERTDHLIAKERQVSAVRD